MATQDLQLTIDSRVVSRLISQGQLKIEDFRCCNPDSKSSIRNMYLEAAKLALAKSSIKQV